MSSFDIFIFALLLKCSGETVLNVLLRWSAGIYCSDRSLDFLDFSESESRFSWRTDDLFYLRITKNLGEDF